MGYIYPMQKTLDAEKLFTGTEWLYNRRLVIDDGLVQSVEPIPDASFVNTGAETFLAPAFVDFQVYGAAQKLFAVYPAADTLRTMNEVFSKEGTCMFQPTLATNTLDVFKEGINAVREYWQEGGKGVAGLHLEGPWINPAKRGAHIENLVHSPSAEEVKELLAYGDGIVKTITVAPEVCSQEVMEILLSSGIVVSAGHSNANFHEATASFEKGIPVVTHLYNAMSPLYHREPGLVGATLQHHTVSASVIPDGHHVDFEAISIAKKLMGSRLFAITDAVTETTEGDYQHQLVGHKYECNGTLSGSAISMHQAFYNLVNEVGIDAEEALRMCSLYPAKILGMSHLYGRLAPGCTAQFIVLNKHFDLTDVIAL